MAQPYLIQLPRITDPRGNLTFVEGLQHIPFPIKRAFWIYDVPGGETRGGHAYLETEELIIALSGSFDVVVHDGKKETRFSLNRSYFGLYIPSGIWRHMENFSTNSIALVLASTFFNREDYIREFQQFLTSPLGDNGQRPEQTFENPSMKTPLKLFVDSTVEDCDVLKLPINHRDKGNITVVENYKEIPFSIQRVYYLYDVPGGESRGGHAHNELRQLIIAAGGSFDVILKDGNSQKTVTLNRPYQALKIVPGIWRELVNFSSGATCLVMASEKYSEEDYIREFEEFLHIKKKPV